MQDEFQATVSEYDDLLAKPTKSDDDLFRIRCIEAGALQRWGFCIASEAWLNEAEGR